MTVDEYTVHGYSDDLVVVNHDDADNEYVYDTPVTIDLTWGVTIEARYAGTWHFNVVDNGHDAVTASVVPHAEVDTDEYNGYTEVVVVESDEEIAPTHDELVEQAEVVLESVKGSMYYPVAHGEAARLQGMIEERKDVS